MFGKRCEDEMDEMVQIMANSGLREAETSGSATTDLAC
jgi:hypothetical protein